MNRSSNRKSVSSGKASRVDDEVARLLSKKTVDKEEFMRLRNRLGDNELVDQVQQAYLEKYESVERRAKAFAKKILEKYGMTNQPFSQLFIKATKYAKKYELSDVEISAFKRILEQELAGNERSELPKVTTNMSKVLGDITIDTKGFGMKVDDADYRELQDIMQMKDESRATHAQVILQSLAFTAGSVPPGQFKPENGHNKACHVHPVIAALFLHKLPVVEQHFLYSNLANIVAARYKQEPFKTRPDYELFYNLVTDPNDVVCDSRSPLKDLKNRCHLQKQLWNSVLALRNGQFYNCDQLDLMRAVDMCRLNKYDTPDLVYGRYDGTIIKRLFAALSFRPTVVLSVPTPQVMSINPYFQSAQPIVSSISMINLRLPQYSNSFYPGFGGIPTTTTAGGVLGVSAPTTSVNLADALTQAQLFFENGSLVMKNTEIIYSRGVLVFFVDRRQHNLDIGKMTNPINMVGLPTAISGFERVNTTTNVTPLTTPYSLTNTTSVGAPSNDVNGTRFNLVSVVCAKTTDITDPQGNTTTKNTNLFIGSETLVQNSNGSAIMRYDPMDVTINQTPLNSISGVTQFSSVPISSTDSNPLINHHGIIFVYRAQ